GPRQRGQTATDEYRPEGQKESPVAAGQPVIASGPLSGGGSGAAPEEVVERPRSRPRRRDVEEQPEVEDGQLALVEDGPEPVARVAHEVGEGHEAAGDEGGQAREEADGDQGAADELDGPRDPDDGGRRPRGDPAEDAQQLLRAMTGEHD